MKEMPKKSTISKVFVICVTCALSITGCSRILKTSASEKTRGADWPMWRYDAGRTAASPVELPTILHLQWKRQLPLPKPAFPDEPRMCFDTSYEPVVMGGTMFVGSMVTDSIMAIDTDTGAEKWKFYADGPVRFAPVGYKSRVYFGSDDGHMYCLNGRTGKLVWKFRGAPVKRQGRRVLGNQRLISRWPMRGGPVLADGIIYFAAGIFPFEGSFIHALDAETGKPIWSNNDCGFIKDGTLDHVYLDDWWRDTTRTELRIGQVRDGGLSPQGYLAIVGENVVVPSGYALPGFLDRENGKLAPYASAWGGRTHLPKGCWYVTGTDNYFFQSGDMYDTATRKRLQIDPTQNFKELGCFREPVIAKEAVYYSQPVNTKAQGSESYRPLEKGYDRIQAFGIADPSFDETEDSPKTPTLDELWSITSDLKVHIKAGSRLYAGGSGVVAAINIPQQNAHAKISWQEQIAGTPSSMLAADGKLFVVTAEGSIYCFADRKVKPRIYDVKQLPPPLVADRWSENAAHILDQTKLQEGYCLALGLGSGRLVEELARRSELHIVVVEPNSKKANTARRKLDEMGLYGTRIHILIGDLVSLQLPQYMASLVICEDTAGCGVEKGRIFFDKLFDSVRPYGGIATLSLSGDQKQVFSSWMDRKKSAGAEAREMGDSTMLLRKGALPGSADWTHECADAGNTFTSKDKLLTPNLGVLWFGNSIDGIFPAWDFTHSKGPAPLVVGGRMFVMVGTELHATDIYTGRHLWRTSLPAHEKRRRGYQPNNYIAVKDSLYVVCGKTCLRLDPATGAKLGRIDMPTDLAEDEPVTWREIRVWKDYLVATTGKHLICMDRYSGEPLWDFTSSRDRLSFAVGNGRVFCVDYSLPAEQPVNKTEDAIIALDAANGGELWRVAVTVSGKKPFDPIAPHLGYCQENDVLVVTVYDKTTGAFTGSDGDILWSKDIVCNDPSCCSVSQPPILHHQMLITHGGKLYDPLTGSSLPTRLWERAGEDTRGCGRALAAEYIVTVRDAFASYWNLETSEQIFLRGLRAGCTNNLIPAGGLLNAPNFARGCSCNYPVFTSMALMPMPETAGWSPPASPKPKPR